MSWFVSLKSKLMLIGGAVIGILMLYISSLKKDAVEKELKQVKAVAKHKDKAVEVLHEKLAEENKPVKRGYFNDK